MALHPIDRDTAFPLPPSVLKWMPDSNLARRFVAVVKGLSLSELERAHAGRGSDAQRPAMLRSLLIHGRAMGPLSSRKIERATFESRTLRHIACNPHPDHDTLASFGKRFGQHFGEIFVQVPGRPVAPTHQVWHRHSGWIEALNRPEKLLIDSGCYSEKNVGAGEAAKVISQIAPEGQGHHPGWKKRFAEPQPPAVDATPVERMKHRLRTKAGRALRALGKQTVEPVFGTIKAAQGLRQFRMLGLDNVQTEWTLVCLARNFKCVAASRRQ